MKMPLIVQKFGGTSVGSIERIHHVAEKIIEAKNEGNQIL
ncbi:aspartate kinase, partial [Vibrio breoganii]